MKHSYLILLQLITFIGFSQQKAYYRTPAIYNKEVVFTAEGDLWKYDITTNQSMRLTTHHGLETEPLITPDGKNIVFTGQYEGPPELYMISIEGGVPKRLTFESFVRIAAIGWTNNGDLIYATLSESPLVDEQLVKLNLQTLATEFVPLFQAADGTYDTQGNLFYTRFGFQGSQTKRYKGGTAQNIWKFSGNSASTCITCDYTGTSREAMFYKDRIYFVSDRDGTMNIWSMNLDGKDLKQHTTSSGYDLQSASIHNSKIVFQKGADIGLYDIDANQEKILDIKISSDFDQRRPRWIKDASDQISYWEISPTGNFVALISRGRLFVSPANGSRWVEITRKSGIRYKAVAFLDDKTVAYLSDESGEFEIWKANADGSSSPVQLTRNSKVLITDIYISPDGKYIAYADKDFKLMIYTVASGTSKLIEQNPNGGFYTTTWTKDSNYFMYATSIDNTSSVIKSYDVTTSASQIITSDRLNSYEPQFSTDNKWLYFVSERNLVSSVSSPWGSRQPEPYFDKTSKYYVLALDEKEKFSFLPPDGWIIEDKDKEEDEEKDKKDSKTSKKKDDKATTPAKTIINWMEASKRLYELPLNGRNVMRMRIAEKHIYWTEIEAGQWNSQKVYSLKLEYSKKFEPTLVAEDVSGFDLSADKKKIIIEKKGILHISDADGSKVDIEKTKVDLSNWAFQFDPIDDWKQMFNDAWRMERDYFYDRNLHGVDWVGAKKKFEPLVDRVSDRFELDNLLAQMVSELSALHTFVYGGDKRKAPDNIQIGSLGAKLTTDPNGKGLVVSHIYLSDPDYPDAASPLNAPNLKIKEGDILVKINDVSVKNQKDLYTTLSNKVNTYVKLTLLNTKNETFDELVKPVSERDEMNLRYAEWELTRRWEVEKRSASQIGYIHLKAMGEDDMNDFVKQFYPVFDRGGLILDVRHNGGGNIDSWVLEKLMRKAWFFWQPRIGNPNWNMQYAFRGHIVVLCDEATGSDGEAVTEGIRRLGLGTIIGTRTWGGEIWLSSSNRLVDGGIATAAEFGVYADGKWLIEGHGVEPDIVVDNEPFETYNGKDAQLDAAIKFLQDKLAKEPVTIPKAPGYPDKSFKYKD